MNIFNMDIGNVKKTTDSAYKISNNLKIYYRLYKNGYLIDMSKFERMTLRFNDVVNDVLISKVYTNVVTINNQQLVEVTIPTELSDSTTKLIITPSVRISNITSNLKPFNLLIFDYTKTEMTMMQNTISRFNYMYGQYLISIKKDQLNVPNGIVGLDKNGKIPFNKLPLTMEQHVFEKIRTSTVHGIRMNNKFMVEYFDNQDEEWYEANSIHGGLFGFENKPEQYNIFGGTFEDIELVDVDGGTFKDSLIDAYSGGTFTDRTSSGIHAGSF